MSHISTYKCKINNLDTFKEICEEEGQYFQEGVHKVEMFGCQSVDAVASFRLPGWKYAIAIDESGNLKYDHWGSEGGHRSFQLLNKLVQSYNERETLKAAFGEGYSVWAEDAHEEGWRQVIIELH